MLNVLVNTNNFLLAHFTSWSINLWSAALTVFSLVLVDFPAWTAACNFVHHSEYWVQHHQCYHGILWQQLHSLCVPHWSLSLGVPHCSCSCQCTQATIVSPLFVVCSVQIVYAVHCFCPCSMFCCALLVSQFNFLLCQFLPKLWWQHSLVRLQLILLVQHNQTFFWMWPFLMLCHLCFMLSWGIVCAVCLEAGRRRCACAASCLFGLQSLELGLACGRPSSIWSKMYPPTACLLSAISALALSRQTGSMARIAWDSSYDDLK